MTLASKFVDDNTVNEGAVIEELTNKQIELPWRPSYHKPFLGEDLYHIINHQRGAVASQ